MMSKMDKIFRSVLNESDIFETVKEIFSASDWSDLRKFKDDSQEFEKKINQKIQSLKKEKNDPSLNNRKKENNEKSIRLCEKLKTAQKHTPNILNQMFNYLDSYGLVKCNLPSMDDYGKVIERYELSTVEQFFLDKIKRENNKYKKRALKRVLEYVKELYNSNQSSLEIAYFIRKLESLTIFWEVLNE